MIAMHDEIHGYLYPEQMPVRCHTRWLCFPADKHCVCDSPYWPQKTHRKNEDLGPGTDVIAICNDTKEMKCEMSLGNSYREV
jgi:hypothetical protein